MKTIIYFLVIALFVILASGCKKTVYVYHAYVEEETPPGTVAPPPARGPSPSPAPSPSGTRPPGGEPAETTSPPAVEATAPSSVRPVAAPSTLPGERPGRTASETRIAEPVPSADVIARFKRTYGKKGNPRIAVFLNRALSDEVREWLTASRDVVSEKARGTPLSSEAAKTPGPGTVPVAATPSEAAGENDKLKERGQATYEQTHIELEQRLSPAEDWMWQFEESFLGEFLRAKAIIVDRATIVRLIATQTGRQGNPYDLLSVKAVEMKALKQKADLFMELLVRRNEASPVGYEFKASVKEVDTGRLLANVSSLRWEQGALEDVTEKRYKATDRGYEVVTVTIEEGTFPKLDRVAAMLALDVMDSLAEIWAPDEEG